MKLCQRLDGKAIREEAGWEASCKSIFYAYLRRTPRTFPWILTLAAGSVDWGHFDVRGLEANHTAFAVEALEGGVGAVDERDDNLTFPGGAGAFDQDVVARDDMFVAHGVATNL